MSIFLDVHSDKPIKNDGYLLPITKDTKKKQRITNFNRILTFEQKKMFFLGLFGFFSYINAVNFFKVGEKVRGDCPKNKFRRV